MDEVPARTRQRHRSSAEWRELLNAWKQSGKTRELWCRENGVGRESLRRWTKRLCGTDAEAAFVQLEEAVPVAANATPMHVRVLASGDVELLGAFNDEVLRQVLRIVREAPHVS